MFSLAKLSTIISIINLTNVTARFVGQVYVESSPPKRTDHRAPLDATLFRGLSAERTSLNPVDYRNTRVTKMAATWTGGHSRATLHFRDNSSSKREDPLIATAGLWVACFATLSRQHSLHSAWNLLRRPESRFWRFVVESRSMDRIAVSRVTKDYVSRSCVPGELIWVWETHSFQLLGDDEIINRVWTLVYERRR